MNALRRHRWPFLAAALLIAIAGVLCLAWHWRNVGGQRWEVLALPIPTSPGASVDGQFKAEVNQPHQLELEVDWTLPDAALSETVFAIDKPAPIDLRWTVLQGQKVIAAGDCRDYLYLEEGGQGLKGRMKSLALRVPYHRECSSGTVSRGMGQFGGQAGQTYQVRAEVGEGLEALASAKPRLVARVNRELWLRKIEQTKNTAYCGLVFLTLAGFLAFSWLMGSLVGARRSTA